MSDRHFMAPGPGEATIANCRAILIMRRSTKIGDLAHFGTGLATRASGPGGEWPLYLNGGPVRSPRHLTPGRPSPMLLITPYRPGLESARLLRSAFQSIGTRARIRRPGKYHRGARAPVINWGNSRAGGDCLNPPGAISIARDKIATFRALTGAGIPCPEWTTDPERARELWGEDRTISRLLTRARAGAGIVPGIVPGAPLYVRAYRKRAEFRAHVIGGRIALVQRKRRKNSTPPGGLIWSHGAGYVFSNRLGDLPGDLEPVAIGAASAIGLDFGAVDIIDHGARSIALEINTAPGLSPSTAAIYSRELSGIVRA